MFLPRILMHVNIRFVVCTPEPVVKVWSTNN